MQWEEEQKEGQFLYLENCIVENNDNNPLLTRIFSVLSEECNDKEEFRISWNLEEILIDNQ